MKYLTILTVVALFINCGSAQKVDTSQEVDTSQAQNAAANLKSAAGDDIIVDALNKKLNGVQIAGFGYKKSNMPASDMAGKVKVYMPVIKEVVNQVPAGYRFKVIGHADGTGPESPEGAKPGNIAISRDRAKAVYNEITKGGIKADKLAYDGAGSSQLKDSSNPKSAAWKPDL